MNHLIGAEYHTSIIICPEISDTLPINALLKHQTVVIVAPNADLAAWWIERCASRSPMTTSASTRDEKPLTVDRLTVHQGTREARWRGTPIKLSQREFRLLTMLARRAGYACSFLDLLRECWDRDIAGSRGMLHSAIKRLRWKLKAAGDGLTVESVPGFGFRLVVPPARSAARGAVPPVRVTSFGRGSDLTRTRDMNG